jgi:hypothetical protein
MVRLPRLSRDAFREHYEDVHVPTALPILGGTTRYQRHHVREEIYGVPPFDCLTAFDYPDAKTVAAVFARTEAPEGAAVRADEQTFMDKPRNFFFAVQLGPLFFDPGPAVEEQRLFLVCARRAANADVTAFRERFGVALEGLRDVLPKPLKFRGFWARDASARYDATALVAAPTAGDLASWARELERDAAQLVAVRVTAHGTKMRG